MWLSEKGMKCLEQCR